MDCSLPGSSLHGILEARVLEWVAISFSRGSSRPRDWTWVSLIADRCFIVWTTRESQPTLCDPKGAIQSMGFSRQEYWSGLPFPSPGDLPNLGIEPGSPALQTDILPSEPPGKPYYVPADSNVYTFQFLLSGIIVSASFWETCLRTQNIRPLNNEKR